MNRPSFVFSILEYSLSVQEKIQKGSQDAPTAEFTIFYVKTPFDKNKLNNIISYAIKATKIREIMNLIDFQPIIDTNLLQKVIDFYSNQSNSNFSDHILFINFVLYQYIAFVYEYENNKSVKNLPILLKAISKFNMNISDQISLNFIYKAVKDLMGIIIESFSHEIFQKIFDPISDLFLRTFIDYARNFSMMSNSNDNISNDNSDALNPNFHKKTIFNEILEIFLFFPILLKRIIDDSGFESTSDAAQFSSLLSLLLIDYPLYFSKNTINCLFEVIKPFLNELNPFSLMIMQQLKHLLDREIVLKFFSDVPSLLPQVVECIKPFIPVPYCEKYANIIDNCDDKTKFDLNNITENNIVNENNNNCNGNVDVDENINSNRDINSKNTENFDIKIKKKADNDNSIVNESTNVLYNKSEESISFEYKETTEYEVIIPSASPECNFRFSQTETFKSNVDLDKFPLGEFVFPNKPNLSGLCSPAYFSVVDLIMRMISSTNSSLNSLSFSSSHHKQSINILHDEEIRTFLDALVDFIDTNKTGGEYEYAYYGILMFYWMKFESFLKHNKMTIPKNLFSPKFSIYKTLYCEESKEGKENDIYFTIYYVALKKIVQNDYSTFESLLKNFVCYPQLLSEIVEISILFYDDIFSLVSQRTNLVRTFRLIALQLQSAEFNSEISVKTIETARLSVFRLIFILLKQNSFLKLFLSDVLFLSFFISLLFENNIRPLILKQLENYLKNDSLNISKDNLFVFISQLAQVIEQIYPTLPDKNGYMLINDMLIMINSCELQIELMSDFSNVLNQTFLFLDSSDLSKSIFYQIIKFFIIIPGIKLNSIERPLKKFGSVSIDEFRLLLNLLASDFIKDYNSFSKFEIKNGDLMNILFRVLIDKENINIVDCSTRLCANSTVNCYTLHHCGYDLTMLNYVLEHRNDYDYNLDSNSEKNSYNSLRVNIKIPDILTNVATIACVVSSPVVVQRFISLFIPIDNRYTSKIHHLLLQPLQLILTRARECPANTLPLNVSKYIPISTTKTQLEKEGFTFTCWIYYESGNEKTNIFSMLNGDEKPFVSLYLLRNLIVVEDVMTRIQLPRKRWEFISLIYHESIFQLFVGSQEVWKKNIEIKFPLGVPSVKIGGIEKNTKNIDPSFDNIDSLEEINNNSEIEGNVHLGNFGLFPLHFPTLPKSIFELGPRSVQKKFKRLFYYSQFNMIELTGFSNNMKNRNFTDILLRFFKIEVLLPFFAQLDLPIINTEQISAAISNNGSQNNMIKSNSFQIMNSGNNFSDFNVIDIISVFQAALFVGELEQIDFYQAKGFSIISHLLLSSSPRQITFQLYKSFFEIMEILLFEEIKKEVFIEIIMNFDLWIVCEPNDHMQILQHWHKTVLPNFHLLFIEFLPFSYLLELIRIYYWYSPIEKNERSFEIRGEAESQRPRNPKLNVAECRSLMFNILYDVSMLSFKNEDFSTLMEHCISLKDDKQRLDLLCFMNTIAVAPHLPLQFITNTMSILSRVSYLIKNDENDEILIAVFNVIYSVHAYSSSTVENIFNMVDLNTDVQLQNSSTKENKYSKNEINLKIDNKDFNKNNYFEDNNESESGIIKQICFSFDQHLEVIIKEVEKRNISKSLYNGIIKIMRCYTPYLFSLSSCISYRLKDMKLYQDVQPSDKFVTNPNWCKWAVCHAISECEAKRVTIFQFLARCSASEWQNIFDTIEIVCQIMKIKSYLNDEYKSCYLKVLCLCVLNTFETKEVQKDILNRSFSLLKHHLLFRKKHIISKQMKKQFKFSPFKDGVFDQTDEQQINDIISINNSNENDNANESTYESVNECVNECVKECVNESVNQSVNQSTNAKVNVNVKDELITQDDFLNLQLKEVQYQFGFTLYLIESKFENNNTSSEASLNIKWRDEDLAKYSLKLVSKFRNIISEENMKFVLIVSTFLMNTNPEFVKQWFNEIQFSSEEFRIYQKELHYLYSKGLSLNLDIKNNEKTDLIETMKNSCIVINYLFEDNFNENVSNSFMLLFNKMKSYLKTSLNNFSLIKEQQNSYSNEINNSSNSNKILKVIEKIRNQTEKNSKLWQRLWANVVVDGGPWDSSSITGKRIVVRWKRDNIFCKYYCPIKLKRNRKPTNHIEASIARDAGSSSTKQKLLEDYRQQLEEEYQKNAPPDLFELPREDSISSSFQNSRSNNKTSTNVNKKNIISENNKSNINNNNVENNKKMLYSFECEWIKVNIINTGTFEIFNDSLHINMKRTKKTYIILCQDIDKLFLRRRFHIKTALEIYIVNGESYFLNFPHYLSVEIVQRILANCPLLREKEKFYKQNGSFLIQKEENLNQFFLKQKFTEKWVNGKMSNFEYLMKINIYSGRSFNDTSQYPFFPWVISSYNNDLSNANIEINPENKIDNNKSDNNNNKNDNNNSKIERNENNKNSDNLEDLKERYLDLEDPANFRDLSKPIGTLGEQRFKELLQRMKDMQMFNSKPYLYSSFAICPLSIYLWMLRMEPYTTLHIEMQSGKFDHPTRLFSSVGDTYKLVTTHLNDYRELPTEFYFLPEIFYNTNELDLGRNSQGILIDDVILPKWANSYYYLNNRNDNLNNHNSSNGNDQHLSRSKSKPDYIYESKNEFKNKRTKNKNLIPEENKNNNKNYFGENLGGYEFVYILRKALESDIVSKNLSKWIDLFWGYKQTGEAAHDSYNLYNSDMYESAWNQKTEKDPHRRAEIEAAMCHVGQMPAQIFIEEHPQKDPLTLFSNSENFFLRNDKSESSVMTDDENYTNDEINNKISCKIINLNCVNIEIASFLESENDVYNGYIGINYNNINIDSENPKSYLTLSIFNSETNEISRIIFKIEKLDKNSSKKRTSNQQNLESGKNLNDLENEYKFEVFKESHVKVKNKFISLGFQNYLFPSLSNLYYNYNYNYGNGTIIGVLKTGKLVNFKVENSKGLILEPNYLHQELTNISTISSSEEFLAVVSDDATLNLFNYSNIDVDPNTLNSVNIKENNSLYNSSNLGNNNNYANSTNSGTGNENLQDFYYSIPFYGDAITCCSVSKTYKVVICGTISGNIVICSLYEGKKVNVIQLPKNNVKNLEEMKPLKIIITKSWGFIVTYAMAKDQKQNGKNCYFIFVHSINGRLIRMAEIPSTITSWCTFSSRKDFDYIVFSNDQGKLQLFEVFYLNIGDPFYRCYKPVVALCYMKEYGLLVFVKKDGNVIFYPICVD